MIFLSFLFVFVLCAKIRKSAVFFLSLLFYFVSLSHAEVTKRISEMLIGVYVCVCVYVCVYSLFVCLFV